MATLEAGTTQETCFLVLGEWRDPMTGDLVPPIPKTLPQAPALPQFNKESKKKTVRRTWLIHQPR